MSSIRSIFIEKPSIRLWILKRGINIILYIAIGIIQWIGEITMKID